MLFDGGNLVNIPVKLFCNRASSFREFFLNMDRDYCIKLSTHRSENYSFYLLWWHFKEADTSYKLKREISNNYVLTMTGNLCNSLIKDEITTCFSLV